EYPWNSPYAFSENMVIHKIELEGLESADIMPVDYKFPLGQKMTYESVEAPLLPAGPIDGQTHTFKYDEFGTSDNLSAYSTWQYSESNGIWTGISRNNYKTLKDGTQRLERTNIPHGCVQNGEFLGDCYSVNRNTASNRIIDTDPAGCTLTLATLTPSQVGRIYNRIQQAARNAVVKSTNGDVTTKTVGVTVSLSSELYTNTNVTEMERTLRQSGKFVGINLQVQLVPSALMSTTDADGTSTEEVGGNISTTTETKALLSDGNR
ncbi:hypothetical protein N9F08_01225, partial [bacterium]|nr:hypothetical protein [bacterium]